MYICVCVYMELNNNTYNIDVHCTFFLPIQFFCLFELLIGTSFFIHALLNVSFGGATST
jgi:hypothetical protein